MLSRFLKLAHLGSSCSIQQVGVRYVSEFRLLSFRIFIFMTWKFMQITDETVVSSSSGWLAG